MKNDISILGIDFQIYLDNLSQSGIKSNKLTPIHKQKMVTNTKRCSIAQRLSSFQRDFFLSAQYLNVCGFFTFSMNSTCGCKQKWVCIYQSYVLNEFQRIFFFIFFFLSTKQYNKYFQIFTKCQCIKIIKFDAIRIWYAMHETPYSLPS